MARADPWENCWNKSSAHRSRQTDPHFPEWFFPQFVERRFGSRYVRQDLVRPLEQKLTFFGEGNPSCVAREQGRRKLLFQPSDESAHCRLCKIQFMGGAGHCARFCDTHQRLEVSDLHRPLKQTVHKMNANPLGSA